MYATYINYLKSINSGNITTLNFKSNSDYCSILEHVSELLGFEYLRLIKTEFRHITDEQIEIYINLNDKYGSPKKNTFKLDNLVLTCSPTSLRYIYHALIILKHYAEMSCENIVEVGCGYGGLCLAIKYFSSILKITINAYNIIDLSEPLNLIENYLQAHNHTLGNSAFTINYHNAETFGTDVNDNKLFFISNYCFTEISEEFNYQYRAILLPKTEHGFITWQNGGNKGIYPINKCSTIINKKILNVIEETPQTDSGIGICKNYFVKF